jgi:hypothetical protein
VSCGYIPLGNFFPLAVYDLGFGLRALGIGHGRGLLSAQGDLMMRREDGGGKGKRQGKTRNGKERKGTGREGKEWKGMD